MVKYKLVFAYEGGNTFTAQDLGVRAVNGFLPHRHVVTYSLQNKHCKKHGKTCCCVLKRFSKSVMPGKITTKM